MLPERTTEFQLIEAFRSRAGGSPSVPLGIGDDAAVVESSEGLLVLASDMLLEGTHFELGNTTGAEPGKATASPPVTTMPYQIGRKCMGANLSDVAAMAGRPRFALVSLAVPKQDPGAVKELTDELFAGLKSMADEFDTVIVGGDTNSWHGPLVVNVAIAGDILPPEKAVTRSGARPGDWIFVTGSLGGSLLGGHLDFVPRVNEARLLNDFCELHAMIDVSDGLVADLYHILEESGVGARLDAASVPVSEAAESMNDDRSPLEHALGDGEDFELLFTVRPGDGRRLAESSPLTIQLTHIGEIVAGDSCTLRQTDGTDVEMPRLGWSHGK